MWAIGFKVWLSVFAFEDWTGKEWFEVTLKTDCAASGAAAAVGGGECFVEVEVHAIEAVISRAGGADHCVHVCSVAEDLSTCLVDELTNLRDLAFKKGKCAGVGDHEGRNGVVEGGFEGFKVTVSISSGGDGFNFVSAAGGGSGVCAVRAVGDENDFALIALTTRFVVCLDEHEAGHFAVGTSDGLHVDVAESGDFAEDVVDGCEHFEGTWDGFVGLHGVDVSESRHAGGDFVDSGVVLHGTRPEGVEAGFDSVVEMAQVDEVSHEFKFADFGEVELSSCCTD